jgi:HSP20 family protein
MPDDIAADKIDANFANGILTIKVPRQARSQPKEEVILVKAA